MPTPNPFPLNIGPKEDTWEKLQTLQHIDPRFKYNAQEWNKVKQALDYLYENIGGGAGPDTDVTRIVKGFTTASSSFLDMVAGIDALSNYTVEAGQIVSFQTSIIDPDDVLNTAIITLNTRDIGAGTYGVGGTSLSGKLWISGTRRLAYGDAEDLPNTQIINLGSHPDGSDVATEFNAVAEFTVQDKTEGLRLVNITIDSVELQYFFTGVGGDYGVGGDLAAVTADFDKITGEVEAQVIPTENQIKGTAQLELTATGAITATFNTHSMLYINQTGNVTLSVTLPTLAIGEKVTRLIWVKPNGNTLTLPTELTDTMSGEVDVAKTNWIAVTYVRIDGSTIVQFSNCTSL